VVSSQHSASIASVSNRSLAFLAAKNNLILFFSIISLFNKAILRERYVRTDFSLQSVSVHSSKSSVFGFKVFLLRFYEIFIMTGKETCISLLLILYEHKDSTGGWESGGLGLIFETGKVKNSCMTQYSIIGKNFTKCVFSQRFLQEEVFKVCLLYLI